MYFVCSKLNLTRYHTFPPQRLPHSKHPHSINTTPPPSLHTKKPKINCKKHLKTSKKDKHQTTPSVKHQRKNVLKNTYQKIKANRVHSESISFVSVRGDFTGDYPGNWEDA